MHRNLLLGLAICSTEILLSSAALSQSTEPIQSKETLAIVLGKEISEEQLGFSMKGQLQRIRQQEFDLKRKALEDVVRKEVLESEAQKKGVSVEKLLENEVDSKVADPTIGELEAYYLGQKHFSQSFEELKENLREALKQAKVQTARDNYLKILQQRADVVVFLQPPRAKIPYDLGRLKGDPQAPVTIVEFTDFSCPFCRQAESTLKQLGAKYQSKISVAHRDFPVRELHPQAQLAAEASRCAAEQRRFWEYHDLLFENPNELARADLVQAAEKLGLDKRRFESCLNSGKYKPQVNQDLQDGIRAGVTGTPSFFINGVYLSGSQPLTTFEKIIDEELQSANRDSVKK